MSIQANCPKCQFALKVRDDLAGKRVKCPKCQEPVLIPGAAAAPKDAPVAAGAGASRGSGKAPATAPTQKAGAAAARSAAVGSAGGSGGKRYNPLLDLLEEAGVEAAPRGDVCGSCGKPLKPGQVLCLECGYHMELGKRMETAILIDDEDAIQNDGRTDAEKRMAKAEREIEDQPIGEFGQDFGDGNESFLIATVAIIFLVLFIAGGVTVVLTMDVITQYVSSQMISLIAAIGMGLMSITWITSVAFRINPVQGSVCLFTAGLYCIPYGFMQGKALFLPAIILSASLIIGLASLYFVLYPPTDEDAMIQMIHYACLTPRMLFAG